MLIDDLLTQARDEAVRQVPAKHGLFDACLRLAAFGEACLDRHLVPFLGPVETMTEVEVERLLSRYELRG